MTLSWRLSLFGLLICLCPLSVQGEEWDLATARKDLRSSKEEARRLEVVEQLERRLRDRTGDKGELTKAVLIGLKDRSQRVRCRTIKALRFGDADLAEKKLSASLGKLANRVRSKGKKYSRKMKEHSKVVDKWSGSSRKGSADRNLRDPKELKELLEETKRSIARTEKLMEELGKISAEAQELLADVQPDLEEGDEINRTLLLLSAAAARDSVRKYYDAVYKHNRSRSDVPAKTLASYGVRGDVEVLVRSLEAYQDSVEFWKEIKRDEGDSEVMSESQKWGERVYAMLQTVAKDRGLAELADFGDGFVQAAKDWFAKVEEQLPTEPSPISGS